MAEMVMKNILIWLPSPLGDAILSTPALAAIRNHFPNAQITFLANPAIRAFLEPTPFCNAWIENKGSFLALVSQLRNQHFDAVFLLKNSFSSALTAFLAGISQRIGYARDARHIFLTHPFKPEKENGDFKPISIVDYYLNLAKSVGVHSQNKTLSIGLTERDREIFSITFPEARKSSGPLIVLVPGGAFGPSKLWPPQRFGELADQLCKQYKACVVLSVAPTPQETAISNQIQENATYPLLSLANRPLKPGPLKALFERADLVIANDTGPRHIAAAFGRKIITLFGPNNPAWTRTEYHNEIQIIGQGDCVPCDKPRCRQKEHLCMLSISVSQILNAVEQMLGTTK
jgi:heptosyltransferase-2